MDKIRLTGRRAPIYIQYIMISLKDGIRSVVHIDFKGQVHKKFRGTNATERCKNEIHILKVLEERGCPNVPRLISAQPEENYIITTNCGSPVEDTIPRKKADSLFEELKAKYGVQHDDPEPRNVTYNPILGKFCLIDFELATVLEQPKTDDYTEQVLRVQWASDSKQGRRHLTNQDSHLCYIQNPEGCQVSRIDQGEALLPCGLSLFAVSDGVGGNHGGEFASKLVLATASHLLETEYENKTLTENDYIELLKKTNTAVNSGAEKNPHSPRLSATYVGILLQDDKILWANAGDSRVYRLRDNELEQLSMDHNFAFRAWKRASLNPEYGTEKWLPGDTYLICSDGIIDGLADRKIEYIMKETEAGLNSTRSQKICNELLSQAVSNDGSDDTTLIVFEIL